jgi:proteasome lid subunit RPN8/RPN11
MITEVVISQELVNAILENAKAAYPHEMVLLLRGKIRKKAIEITDILIPPLATGGNGFASFSPSMLPMDLSLIGSAHSHPSGITEPSVVDLNRAFGRIIMVVSYPFLGRENVVVYNREGQKIVLHPTE